MIADKICRGLRGEKMRGFGGRKVLHFSLTILPEMPEYLKRKRSVLV